MGRSGGLEAVLATDVRLSGDGGGKVPAPARALSGRARVARTLHAWVMQMMRVPDLAMRGAEVNGAPGILILDGRGRLFSVWALDIAGSEVVGIDAIVNPDKLRHLGPVADYEELRRSARVTVTPARSRVSAR